MALLKWKEIEETPRQVAPVVEEAKVVPLRQAIGEVLRDVRQRQGRTLREVSQRARVSLGYLSEVERGQKEASSELLAWICQALDIPMSQMLREVADRMAVLEGVQIPDTVPAEMSEQYREPLLHSLEVTRGGTCRAKREAMPCIPVRWVCGIAYSRFITERCDEL